jgi:hypothetical protein
MLQRFLEGGPSMFGVVGFGLVALAASGLFAWKPDVGRLGFITGMGLATLFMTLAAVAMDVGQVMRAANSLTEAGKLTRDELPLLVMQGLGESLQPALFGFTLLAMVALVCAVGSRRLHRAR